MSTADAYDRLPDAVTDVFGPEATAAYAYDLLTVDVPATGWTAALETARSALGCTYFDWLSAVDEPGTGFRVCAHVAALGEGTVRRLLIRTTVPHEAATLPSAVDVYAGAAWHERETHEMFGIGFEDHPHLVPLLLPEGFEGHPLRKDFVLAARVAKAWPGAKEPGESEHGGPKRRTMLPPGVPDPNEWGPLKGQLPPAPSRPARAARAAGDRPVRRARSASEGSAAQRAATPEAPGTASGPAPGASAPAPGVSAPGPGAGTTGTPGASGGPEAADGAATGTPGGPEAGARGPAAAEAPRAARPRRNRSASQGSASQTAPPAPAPSEAETGAAGTGAAEAGAQAAPPVPPVEPATGDGTGADAETTAARPARQTRPARGSDAPWHHARPAFDDTPSPKTDAPGPTKADTTPEPRQPAGETESETETETESGSASESAPAPAPESAPAPTPESGDGPTPESGDGAGAEADADTGAENDTGAEADAPEPRTDRPAGGDTA
ncbi:NADH-quinone oxidoreductase subunit C [Streptomyces halstedii]|uniref:NADH-quinone oxidoreductase subunit C n=1 Tax=Streptomyces halstedii TaxID=1944 RepID=UPI003685E66C